MMIVFPNLCDSCGNNKFAVDTEIGKYEYYCNVECKKCGEKIFLYYPAQPTKEEIKKYLSVIEED